MRCFGREKKPPRRVLGGQCPAPRRRPGRGRPATERKWPAMMSVPGSNPRRWGIYVRISGDSGERGDEDYISLETEEAGCRELIGATGGLVDERHVYREVWTGVELFQRPVLIRLRETIRRGELDAVAVYQPKRWSRDPDHAAYLKT